MKRLQHLKDSLRRLGVAGCIALVLALGVFAVCPSLHACLHHNDEVVADDGCAVVLYANGVSVPLACVATPPVPVEWNEPAFAATTFLFLDSPHYLLLPGRGPPVV